MAGFAHFRRGALVGAAVAVIAVTLDAMVAFPHALANGAVSAAAYVAIALTLATVAALVLGSLVGAVAMLARMAIPSSTDHDDGSDTDKPWRGLYAPDSQVGRGAVAWVHGSGFGIAVFVPGAALIVSNMASRFIDPGLIGLVSAVACAVWAMVSIVIAIVTAHALRNRHLLADESAAFDPLASVQVAVALWIIVAWIAAFITRALWEPFRIAFPLRMAITQTLVISLLVEGRRLAAVLCDTAGRWRRGVIGIGVGLAVLTAASLIFVADAGARRAVLRSPSLALLLDVVRMATDIDRDGDGSLLGGPDCAPFDGAIHSRARDLPNDGIDQNCSGADFVPTGRPSPLPDTPVPAAWRLTQASILLITIDTLRVDHMSVVGYGRPTTPNLDALARRGVWFDRFYSTGNGTVDVLPSLVTSQFPDELPLGERIRPKEGFPRRLLPAAVTLAERLAARGFETAQFSAMGYFDDWGIEQGAQHVVNLPQIRDGYEQAGALTDRAMAWIDSRPGGARWHAWVHYYEPHRPYDKHSSARDFGDTELDRYDAELSYVDQQIGRWRAWLAGDPVRLANTIVVITSDHGELFGELGLSGHGKVLFEAVIRVPLILTIPNVGPRRVASIASAIDIAPTLAALAGIAPDPSWTGRALIGEIVDNARPPQRYVFAADTSNQIYAVISGRWKLIWNPRHNITQLVDLIGDPAEESDASSAQPDVAKRLEQALLLWRERVTNTELVRDR